MRKMRRKKECSKAIPRKIPIEKFNSQNIRLGL